MRFDFPTHRSGDTWRGISSITILDDTLPIDLTNCKIYIQFRSIYNLASPVALLLSTNDNTVFITFPTLGIISIPSQVINLPVGRYRYDLQIDFPDNSSKTFLEGEWEVIPGITTPSFDSTVNSRFNSLKINSLISLVSANSAMWGYMANDIKALTGIWQNASTVVQNNSANWSISTLIKNLSAYWNTEVESLTGKWENSSTIVQNNSSNWDRSFLLSSSIISLTANWQNSYTLTSENSSTWDSVYTSVNPVSANWDSVYTSVKDTSANWDSVYSSVNPVSANWNSVYSSVNLVSANWDSVYTSVKDTSANWDSVYTSVKDTSANWDSVYTSVKDTSANWDSVYTSVKDTSATWDSVYTSVKDTSANWDSVYTSVKDTSANWDSVYTSVKDTSANWDSVYTSVKDTSANWDSVYTSVKDTSATWDSVYTSVKDTSANWDSVYTSVKDTSANWDSVYTSVKDTSANWDSVYTSVKDTSATWDSVYTSVKDTSANWDSVYTSVKDTSANWDSVYTSVKDTSANWDSVYTSVKDTSANWDSVYTSVKDTSANWDSVYTSVKDTSANWDSVYTTYNINSATYATISFVDTKFLPLSGGKIDGDLIITGDLSILGSSTIIETNISVTSALEINNSGTAIALTVNQNGNSDIAKFSDDRNTILVLKNGGNVGIKTDDPNVELTVNGSISSNSTIYDKAGNSDDWNSVFSTVSVNSALNWVQGTELRNLSGHWESSYTTVLENSSKWLSDTSITQEFFDDFLTLGAGSTLPLSFLKPANLGGAIFVAAENTKQGVLILSTNPVISSNQRSGVTSNATIHLGQGSEYRLIFSARRGTNSFSSLVSGVIDIGFHDQIATNNILPDDGCFFTSVNGGNWNAYTVTAANPAIITDTGIPCDTTWRTFEIKINSDSTTANYYIDNVLVANHNNSIPKDPGAQTAIGYRCFRQTANPLNVELRLDWQSLIIKRNTKLWE